MYDLGVIGAGPAGYVAAERAGQKGLKTVLFNKEKLGGVCLNEGCIPTKTLLYTAKMFEHASKGDDYGINSEDVTFDFKKIIKRKNKVVKKLVAGIGAAMKKYKVEVIDQKATIQNKDGGAVVIKAGDATYTCKSILIASGSEPIIPPIKGLKKEDIYTNKEILDLNELPDQLTIIGAGYIGVEFANFFASMGTKVSVVEMLDEIVPGIDPDLTSILRKELEKKGVEFHLSTKVTEKKGDKLIVENKDGKGEIKTKNLLVSVGRKPVLDGLGLDTLGVNYDQKGIKIDKQCKTNIPNVYAAGDVKGFSLLAHTASREGEVVVNTIAGKKDEMRYKAIPGVVYTNPEIATVGLSEKEAKEQKIACKTVSLPMTYAGRFMAENEGFNGLAKVVVGEKYHEILGVHVIGNPGSEFIYGAAMAIEMEMTLKDIQQVVFPHPTVSEIFREAAFHLSE
jgi:dihydrolipoamide dehydrogenase